MRKKIVRNKDSTQQKKNIPMFNNIMDVTNNLQYLYL